MQAQGCELETDPSPCTSMNKVPDLSTCMCACPPTAPDPTSCNFPQTFNANSCDCVCPTQSCPTNAVLSNTTCSCMCNNLCPGEQVPNLDSECACECPAGSERQEDCSLVERYNAQLCQCECVPPLPTCMPPQTFLDTTCACGCANQATCERLNRFNLLSCACECPDNARDLCAPDEEFNEALCGCEVSMMIPTCGPFEEFNTTTNQCECIERTCTPQQVFNTTTCFCDCADLTVAEMCTSRQFFDRNTCMCECNPSSITPNNCNPPMMLNIDSCECEPLQKKFKH